MCRNILLILVSLFSFVSLNVGANPVLEVELTLPKLPVDPYHRPYVAVWLESTNRQAVATLGVWTEDEQWLKDLRQWWRKVGRGKGDEMDAVTGATRKPGTYSIVWDGMDNFFNKVPKGEYLLNVEASREEGGRSYHRQRIYLGEKSELMIPGQDEFGEIVIKIL